MDLNSIDFQPLVHQHVTELMDAWRATGFSEEDMQEAASHFFQMGIIASQQVQQEGGIQPQGTETVVPYTQEMAERVVTLFIDGLNAAALKAFEQRLPSQEKWQLIQLVAYHVFEHSKQAVIATLGQEHTPDVQISDDQILNWLGQTAIEALLYYINEHERQHGPIARVDEEIVSDLDSPPEVFAEEPYPVDVSPEEPMAEIHTPVGNIPEPQPQATSIPEGTDLYHKYAAVGLLLGSVSSAKQAKILAAFTPEEQHIINQYRDPEFIARHLDMALVAKYLKAFKEKMGQGKSGAKSRYATAVSQVVELLPPQRLERLFQNERPIVRGYIQQFLQKSSRGSEQYSLPAGVEESLILYLQRNFPSEITSR